MLSIEVISYCFAIQHVQRIINRLLEDYFFAFGDGSMLKLRNALNPASWNIFQIPCCFSTLRKGVYSCRSSLLCNVSFRKTIISNFLLNERSYEGFPNQLLILDSCGFLEYQNNSSKPFR